jgi:hypothetical protein
LLGRAIEETKIIPFNDFPGCFLFRPDLTIQRIILPDGVGDMVYVDNLQSLTVFGDHSVVCLEMSNEHRFRTSKNKSRLREYPINFTNGKTIQKTPVDAGTLKRQKSEDAIFTFFKSEEDIIGVIVDKDGTIEIIHYLATA